MRTMKRLLFPFFLFLFNVLATGQTCCSGGVPLSSNLGLPTGEAKTFQIAVTYDLNVLETLKTGKQRLEDDSRSRRTHSGILELGYSFTNRFSVDGFFSFVRQEREINQFNNTNFSATNGIGDAVLLFKYKLWSTRGNKSVLQIGIGPKIPFGTTTKTNEIGLSYNADLQPGSGAWDGVLFTQFSHVLDIRPSMSFLATSTYGLKGKNNNYFEVQTYQFGNEFQIALGLSDRVLLGKAILDPAVLVQFRNQAADQIDAVNLPSTGGNWLFINPSLTYWLSPDMSFSTGVSLPIFSEITGTQVTPTYRFTTGVFYRIPGKRKELINF